MREVTHVLEAPVCRLRLYRDGTFSFFVGSSGEETHTIYGKELEIQVGDHFKTNNISRRALEKFIEVTSII